MKPDLSWYQRGNQIQKRKPNLMHRVTPVGEPGVCSAGMELPCVTENGKSKSQHEAPLDAQCTLGAERLEGSPVEEDLGVLVDSG